MKRILLVFGFIVLAMAAYSQEIHFTKGGVNTGKMKNGQDFENFITGKIKIKDDLGREYSFVKADFVMKTKASKELKYSVVHTGFTAAQVSAILDNGRDGASYTFKNIVVKDNLGKETVLPEAGFVYDPYSMN